MIIHHDPRSNCLPGLFLLMSNTYSNGQLASQLHLQVAWLARTWTHLLHGLRHVQECNSFANYLKLC